jgi:alpha-glucoside transport system substrate-binding protein
VYDAWVAHDVEFSSRHIATAVAMFGAIALDGSRVSGGNRAAVERTVQQAAQGLVAGRPECLLHRQASFLPDLLGSAGEGVEIAPDGDLWVFPFPGEAGAETTMLIGGTAIARFTDTPAARQVAAYLASPAAAAQRAAEPGFITPLQSFDPALYPDALDRTLAEWTNSATVVRFDASDLVGVGAFWEACTWLNGARLAPLTESTPPGRWWHPPYARHSETAMADEPLTRPSGGRLARAALGRFPSGHAHCGPRRRGTRCTTVPISPGRGATSSC